MQSDPAKHIAQILFDGYQSMFLAFQGISAGAGSRFEQSDWHAVHAAVRERLTLYRAAVTKAVKKAESQQHLIFLAPQTWSAIKRDYALLAASDPNEEVARSFYNSAYCKVFNHSIDPHRCFISEENPVPNIDERLSTCTLASKEAVSELLQGLPLTLAIANVDKVASDIISRVQLEVSEVEELVTFKPLFFRNKGAYLIGYLLQKNGVKTPFAIAIKNAGKQSLVVDAIVFGEDSLSLIFSFTRSYFMVDCDRPASCVAFLQQLLPAKEQFELYTSIGFAKHGKTEFYRYAVNHTLTLPDSERYSHAPGIKGMVMLVFTTPSLEYVYKIIKDKVTPPKDVSRQQVIEKYDLVRRADRAGRMADNQEFKNLAFDSKRFDKELLDEIYTYAPSVIREEGNAVIISHVYVERRMTPLNLYLRSATAQQIDHIMWDYGNAIKQMLAANIFPGDMLLKNFGVTRHQRVVFYDYDEVVPLSDCTIKAIPEAQNEEQEMSGEIWYPVGVDDIFPEEFKQFLSSNRSARESFERHHADLYSPSYWQALQQSVDEGEVADIFPYSQACRLKVSEQ